MTRREAQAVLGLKDGASVDDIKSAYRKLAFALHPDLHPENPNAGKEFQKVNEAYVFLSSPEAARQTRSSARGKSRAAAQAESTKKAWTEAEKAYAKAKKRFQEEAANRRAAAEAQREAENCTCEETEKKQDMERDEVLRDLLRDPFARRVFEDIYSQIREDSERKQSAPGRKGAPARKAYKAPSKPGILGKTADNVSDWLRRQIDEEQTVRFAGVLAPGKRIRLQIHHGVFGKPHTIEITLPPEFEPGRPIRLKGLGKRIGSWRGDLYLRIVGSN